jgi:hypothetical protein
VESYFGQNCGEIDERQEKTREKRSKEAEAGHPEPAATRGGARELGGDRQEGRSHAEDPPRDRHERLAADFAEVFRTDV